MNSYEIEKRSREISEIEDPRERNRARGQFISELYDFSCFSLVQALKYPETFFTALLYFPLVLAILPLVLFVRIVTWADTKYGKY